MSCSWGDFQIMGDAFRDCDCKTIFEFAKKFLSGADGQAELFIAFMKNSNPDGVVALRNHQWERVASSYNGGNWRNQNPDYAKNLEEIYSQFK